MENWITEIMNEFGYMGVMFLIALENIFPPIPSEVILTFGGFMTTTTNLTIFKVVLSATAGSVVGAIVLYMIGLQLDVERLEKIVDRWGHILRLKKSDIHKADAWFDKYGPWAVFLCRFIPLIRSLISIPAGMSNMNVGIFLIFTTIGTFIWNIVLVNLGASLGNSWDVIVYYMDIYSNIIYAILLLLFIIFVFVFVKKRR
ncbi:DedA family protein [Oceanobacillus caeni]|uniref:DedA family protein n=1 Tax=Oceanobacillus TaxID=182709 RepID=UPI000621100D|nr:DedA family protein [Oceanobacillus caeni]KKE80783.1 alkaline phosphatase [Bacilli bacterium VT-13-104]PZD83033.1 DedA family protein [Bacilli bacterium]MBU8791871.1 DedA family protein [Oceanobacillus caeni]MCR1835408.1 DedA family protein [Oceanobacillus caeni]MED4475250.1 DedA family protein [Oceanobacillus caeni]